MNKNTAGVNIKILLASKGMTQEKLAEKLGISVPSTNRKISGKNEWSLIEASIISNLFGVSIEQIFLSEKLPIGRI